MALIVLSRGAGPVAIMVTDIMFLQKTKVKDIFQWRYFFLASTNKRCMVPYQEVAHEIKIQ